MTQPPNQIQLTPENFSRLIDSTCELLECEHENIKNELSRRSKESIKTSLGRLYSTPLNIIKKIAFLATTGETHDEQAKHISNLLDTHDVRDNVYEGGFKVWEGSRDLINFLDNNELIRLKSDTVMELNILEIGAGAALPAIFCLTKLMKGHKPNQIFNLHIQDFNEEVLSHLALLNLGVNLGSNAILKLLQSDRIKAFYGPWSDFCSSLEYDIIIMSETIYNVESYNSLHNLLVRHLKQDGVIVLAAKDTYFGCTGSLFEWEDFVNERKNFSITSTTKTNNSGIPRSVLTMEICKPSD